jgi:hypothetical protein
MSGINPIIPEVPAVPPTPALNFALEYTNVAARLGEQMKKLGSLGRHPIHCPCSQCTGFFDGKESDLAVAAGVIEGNVGGYLNILECLMTANTTVQDDSKLIFVLMEQACAVVQAANKNIECMLVASVADYDESDESDDEDDEEYKDRDEIEVDSDIDTDVNPVFLEK